MLKDVLSFILDGTKSVVNQSIICYFCSDFLNDFIYDDAIAGDFSQM
jgi:hypothetical protein